MVKQVGRKVAIVIIMCSVRFGTTGRFGRRWATCCRRKMVKQVGRVVSFMENDNKNLAYFQHIKNP